MSDHSLRARTLIERGDPRIDAAVKTLEDPPASPDAAYWQAALTVAEEDARSEVARRDPAYRVGHAIGTALGRLVCLVLPSEVTPDRRK